MEDIRIAGQAGIAPGMKLITANARRWHPESLREAIRQAKGGRELIELLLENHDCFHSDRMDHHCDEGYPHLERIGGAADLHSEIAKMKEPSAAAAKE